MPTVTFHHHDGADADVLDVEPGTSLMRAAVRNGVGGIVGECGGQAMCATCHVYVREPYLGALPEVGADEDEMLDCTPRPATTGAAASAARSSSAWISTRSRSTCPRARSDPRESR